MTLNSSGPLTDNRLHEMANSMRRYREALHRAGRAPDTARLAQFGAAAFYCSDVRDLLKAVTMLRGQITRMKREAKR